MSTLTKKTHNYPNKTPKVMTKKEFKAWCVQNGYACAFSSKTRTVYVGNVHYVWIAECAVKDHTPEGYTPHLYN